MSAFRPADDDLYAEAFMFRGLLIVTLFYSFSVQAKQGILAARKPASGEFVCSSMRMLEADSAANLNQLCDISKPLSVKKLGSRNPANDAKTGVTVFYCCSSR